MARRLRVTLRRLRAEAEAGRIPCIHAEKQLLFNSDVVERLLLERAGKPIAEIEDADQCREQRKGGGS